MCARPVAVCTLFLLLAVAAAGPLRAQSAPAWQPLPTGRDFEFSGALRQTSFEPYEERFDPWAGESFPTPGTADLWYWQFLPDGILYPAYLAGRLETRMSTVWLAERDAWLWDSTIGGRLGVVRYGDTAVTDPQGWQLDLEGAAMVRLNLDNERDLDNADFRFGIPLTYACGPWQFKFAYYHLSSHLGDEFIARNPGATGNSYARDALVFGAGVYPHPDWRLYAEAGWAFRDVGGSEPWEFQFGVDYSPADSRDRFGDPFFAVNGHLRQEVDFSGNFVAQAGWQWRGTFNDHLFRIGVQYFNGQSTAFQFFRQHEEQLGVGMWYDY